MDKAKTVMIGGVEIGSLAQAAEETGLSRLTVRSRILDGIVRGYFVKHLGWIVDMESARQNSGYLKPGPKPKAQAYEDGKDFEPHV